MTTATHTISSSLRDRNGSQRPGPDLESLGIRVSEWLPGTPPRQLTTSAARDAEGVLCFEVEMGQDPIAVFDALQPLCGDELEPEMLVDLLDPDELPKVQRHRGRGDVRSVSAFGVKAQQPPANAEGKAGSLVFDLVECVANNRWLIICCHSAQSYAGEGTRAEDLDAGCNLVLQSIEREWAEGDFRSAGDLGVLILHELGCSYAGACRDLERWLESWELGFFRGEKELDQKTLVDLRGLIAQFRQRLTAMNVRRYRAATSWFRHVTNDDMAQRVDEVTDDALKDTARLTEMLGHTFELMHVQTTARQLELAQKQQKNAERLQMRIELIASVFLVPTLIAGIFGANTALPGGNDPNRWLGFELMAGAMVLGGVAVFLIMRRIRRLSEREESR